MSEAEYAYLESLLRKAREDTREEEIAQEEGKPKGGDGERVSDPSLRRTQVRVRLATSPARK